MLKLDAPRHIEALSAQPTQNLTQNRNTGKITTRSGGKGTFVFFSGSRPAKNWIQCHFGSDFSKHVTIQITHLRAQINDKHLWQRSYCPKSRRKLDYSIRNNTYIYSKNEKLNSVFLSRNRSNVLGKVSFTQYVVGITFTICPPSLLAAVGWTGPLSVVSFTFFPSSVS